MVASKIQKNQALKLKEKKEIENLKKQIQKAQIKGLSKSQVQLLKDRKKKREEDIKKLGVAKKKTLSTVGKGILAFAEAVDSYNKPVRKKKTTNKRKKRKK